MPLNLYRLCGAACTQKRKPGTRTRKPQEAPSLGWKKCHCPIYASGTLNGLFNRKNTDKVTWDEAEQKADLWEKAGSWTLALTTPAPVPVVVPATASSKTEGFSPIEIEKGLAAYIAKCQLKSIKLPTLRKYKTLTKQFQAYANSRGYVLTSQLTENDAEAFYSTWKDKPRAAGKKLERFRRLVRYWMKKKWITHDLGLFDIEKPIGANEPADQNPFTDDEMHWLYEACRELEPVTWKNHYGSGAWDGDDVQDFILLSVYTGLRISDVALFDVKERMQGNNIFIRAKKNNRRLFTWVPDWVRDRMLDRQAKYGPKIFMMSESTRLDTVTDLWRRKLKKIYKLAVKDGAFFDQKFNPHRFRYTFIRILLEYGVPVPDVAELAGDTEEVIWKYYAKWVPERQNRLTNILKEAFEQKPRLIVVKR